MPSMNKRSRMTKTRLNKRKSNCNVKEYHSMDWRKHSKQYRLDNPKCVGCGGNARCVDHVIPVRIGGSFWDIRNHQSLCNSCHAKKSSDESRDIYINSIKNIDEELIPNRGGLKKSKYIKCL